MTAVIEARDLFKCYPGFPPVLRGVNIDVQPGEMVAIMGPSGCGKSTMLHILGMLHRPDSGSLQILGQNVLAFSSEQTAAFRRGNMGFVMQASNLFEHSTVFENVEFPLIYENVPPQERWERVIRALELVRLSPRVHYRSNRLSGGEQQRVAIARAMVNNPRILLADEPTGALDARTSAVIMENFRSLCHNGGVAMVMVTHDPKMAEYCDSIYTLEEGSLHCKKHDPPHVAATSAAEFLNLPEPLVRGSLVAWQFPSGASRNVLELSRRMHAQRLLARIYSLKREALLGAQGGYSLPLAVRHGSYWQRQAALRKMRASQPGALAEISRRLADSGGRLSSFQRRRALGNGALLAVWAQADNIEFLYAAGARRVAAATWVAASLLKLPFAFAVRPEDMTRLGNECQEFARAAAFITCSTPAIADAFRSFVKATSPEKILVLPNLPFYSSLEEDPEPGLPPQPGKPFEILAMPPETGSAFFRMMIEAARKLRKSGFKFHITAIGRASFWLRMRLWLSGMRKLATFTGKNADDRLAEIFRTADAFAGWPLAGPGMDLAMPGPLCEAMSFGLPVIALGISTGMAPLEPGTSCILAENADAVAEAVKKISADQALAKKLGNQARAGIRAFLDARGTTRMLTDRIVESAALSDRKKSSRK